MPNITLKDLFDTIREERGITGAVNWEDWGDLKIGFYSLRGEEPCLSIYLSPNNKDEEEICIDIGKDINE